MEVQISFGKQTCEIVSMHGLQSVPDSAFTLSALLFPMERSDFERLKGACGTNFFVFPSGVVSDIIHISLK